MSDENQAPEWPEEIEDIAAEESAEAEPATVAALVATSLPEDAEDRRYVKVVGRLSGLTEVSMLMLSDGVTSHTVKFEGISAKGRTYLIHYYDPGGPGPGLGSFLQKGKNAAGVAAQAVEGKPGHWKITHEELMRVFDDFISFTAPGQ